MMVIRYIKNYVDNIKLDRLLIKVLGKKVRTFKKRLKKLS